jgi:uncharacterized protein DUF2799
MRLLLLLTPLLAGCALFPLQEKDCVGVNWEQRGYADGFSGQFQQYLRLAEECPRFGVTVSEADYFRGWNAGHDEWYRLIGSMDRRP